MLNACLGQRSLHCPDKQSDTDRHTHIPHRLFCLDHYGSRYSVRITRDLLNKSHWLFYVLRQRTCWCKKSNLPIYHVKSAKKRGHNIWRHIFTMPEPICMIFAQVNALGFALGSALDPAGCLAFKPQICPSRFQNTGSFTTVIRFVHT